MSLMRSLGLLLLLVTQGLIGLKVTQRSAA